MLALIDYGMGNLGSVKKAFEFIGAEVKRTDKPADLRKARGLILPGVGAFPAAMKNLAQRRLIDVIRREVAEGKPFLGICLGYQLLFDSSTEMGDTRGLGLIRGRVRKFETDLKVPHMGWNSVTVKKKDIVARDVMDGDYFYFVHSYYPELEDTTDALFETEYGVPFTSAIARGNIYGFQFHPEKSQEKGLSLIRNFMDKVCR
ncbi:MAG: imidazole glycerol phosphate synthase subunit HisH [Spirochaetota bacterium]